jgi:hypothetical protein
MLLDISLDRKFLDKTLKAQETKAKIDKQVYIKPKNKQTKYNLLHIKESRVPRQPT